MNALLLGLIPTDVLFAQTPGDILWTRRYGGDMYDEANAVKPTPEGGYILVGYTQSFGLGRFGNGFVAKTNGQGDTLWTRQFGDDGSDVLVSVQVLPDSGYITTGLSDSPVDFEQVWLVRLSKDGTILWQKRYGGPAKDIGYAVLRTPDGGFIVAGTTNSFGAGGEDFWLLRTNGNGDSLWSKTFGTANHDFGWDMKPTLDGGYIVTGPYNDQDIWLLKLNANGDTLWTRSYGGSGYEEAPGVIETADHGYLMVGSTSTWGAGELDAYVIKVDSLGNEQWSRTYGTATYEEGRRVVQCPSGGYLIAGNAGYPDMQYWLIRVNEQGDTLWTRKIGSVGTNRCFDLMVTADDNYLAAGSIFDSLTNGDAALTKVAGDGQTSVSSGSHIPGTLQLFQNYPNPFNPETRIEFSLPARQHVRLSIVDVLGREVVTLVDEIKDAGMTSVFWDGKTVAGAPVASGVYFSTLRTSISGPGNNPALLSKRLVLLK